MTLADLKQRSVRKLPFYFTFFNRFFVALMDSLSLFASARPLHLDAIGLSQAQSLKVFSPSCDLLIALLV